MAELQETLEALLQVGEAQLIALAEIKRSLDQLRQGAAGQGPTGAPSASSAPSASAPSAGKAASGKSEAEKAAEKRSKALKRVGIEAAGRIADPFEPKGLALLDAAEQGLATQIGAGAAKLAINAGGGREERFIQQQTFASTASDAANLAAMNIRLDPAIAKEFAAGNRASAELLAENLKAAASGADSVAVSSLADKASSAITDSQAGLIGTKIADVLRSLLGGGGGGIPAGGGRQ